MIVATKLYVSSHYCHIRQTLMWKWNFFCIVVFFRMFLLFRIFVCYQLLIFLNCCHQPWILFQATQLTFRSYFVSLIVYGLIIIILAYCFVHNLINLLQNIFFAKWKTKVITFFCLLKFILWSIKSTQKRNLSMKHFCSFPNYLLFKPKNDNFSILYCIQCQEI